MKQNNLNDRLPEGFILRAVQDDSDVQRLARFNKIIHSGEDLESLVGTLIKEHPYGKRHYWLYLEETQTKKIVSSVALVPWKINFGGETLTAAELGFVGTLPDYRNRGFARICIEQFHRIVEEEGFAFSFLQGIPYYYRQFGYEYAIPLEPMFNLELAKISSQKDQSGTRFMIRRAEQSDLPHLKRLYERSMRHYEISTNRSLPVWQFLLGPSLRTEMIRDTYCVVDLKTNPVAYFRIAHHGFGEGLIVDEVSDTIKDVRPLIMSFLKKTARERKKPYIRFNLSPKHEFVRFARRLGAEEKHVYAFQIRIGNTLRFLKAILPVLEKRISESSFSGLTGKVNLNLYKEAFLFHFHMGKIKNMDQVDANCETPIRLPPFAALQLFFGHRSILELKSIYPDVWIENDGWKVLDILFPKLDSFLHTNY
jgi:predicted acetyltransferase